MIRSASLLALLGLLFLLPPPSQAEPPAVAVGATELWRAGGDREGDGHFFGVINDAAQAPDGSWYVLDQQLSEVKRFSAGGEFLGRFGREGEAPGEFTRAGGIAVLPGGQVMVVQRQPARIVLFTADGEPLDDWRLPPRDGEDGFMFLSRVEPLGDALVLEAMGFQRGEGNKSKQTRLLMVVDATGTIVARLARQEREMSFSNFVVDEAQMFRPPWVTNGKRVYEPPTPRYSFTIRGAEGEELGELARPYESIARSEEEQEERRRELVSGISIRTDGGEVDVDAEVLPYEPDIASVGSDAAGRIWVQNSRQRRAAEEAGVAGSYDVFSPDGEWVAQATLDIPMEHGEDRLVLRGGHALLLTDFASANRAQFGGGPDDEDEDAGEDAEPMELVVYELGTAALP